MPRPRGFSLWVWIQLWVANALLIPALKVWSFQQVMAGVSWMADLTGGRRARVRADNVKVEVLAAGRAAARRVKRGRIIKGRCLSRSVALYGLLRRYEVLSTVRIGVSMQEGFRAHAWVECDGEPVNAGTRVQSRFGAFERAFGLEIVERSVLQP